MLGTLALLLLGNLLVHLESVGIASTAEVGNRLGVATLLMLISFVGGRIIASFTRSWLTEATAVGFRLRHRSILSIAPSS
jgi:uncharacterized protein involved in response to NO